MNRKIYGVLVVAVGIVFITVALVNQLFSVGPAFERMTDNFRPQMTEANITALRQDLIGMEALPAEFQTKLVPQLAAALKVTPTQLQQQIATTTPAVAAGVQALPQITTTFTGVLDTLDAEQARFAKADQIPTASLPATTVPWAILIAGVLAIGIGIAMLSPGFMPAALAVILGVLLVAGPLVLSLPEKSSAADTMNDNLKPVYTAQLVAGAEQSLAVVKAMGTEMQTALPAFAQALQMTPAQLQAYFGQNFPVLSQALAQMPAMIGRFENTVTTFKGSLADYGTIKPVSLVPIVWTLIAGGALIVVLGGLATRRPEEVVVRPPIHLRRAA